MGNSRCTRGNQGRISGVPGALGSAACEAGESGLGKRIQEVSSRVVSVCMCVCVCVCVCMCV